MANQPVVDPWLLDANGNNDIFAQTVDFRLRPEDAIDPEAPQLPSTPVATDPVSQPPEPETPPTPAPVAVEPEPEGPEILELEGGTAQLEKEKGQWKLTVSSETGGRPQVYWGKTKNELFLNMAKAQLNATKKIRELNAQVKLGTPVPKSAQQPVEPTNRNLTAEEIFEIKTQLEADPDKAFSAWFQKKTGLSVEQLVGLAQKGAKADANLEAEAVTREFLSNNPDYFAAPRNFELMVKWLTKFKLGQAVSGIDEGMSKLLAAGAFTVENLEEAFKDLSEDGLLVVKPSEAPKAPPVAAQEPAQPAPRPDERIVRTETRPRAALGIRSSDVTPVPAPEAEKAPSVEDLESMSDEEIGKLLSGVHRLRAVGRRS